MKYIISLSILIFCILGTGVCIDQYHQLSKEPTEYKSKTDEFYAAEKIRVKKESQIPDDSELGLYQCNASFLYQNESRIKSIVRIELKKNSFVLITSTEQFDSTELETSDYTYGKVSERTINDINYDFVRKYDAKQFPNEWIYIIDSRPVTIIVTSCGKL